MPPENYSAIATKLREEHNSVVLFFNEKIKKQWLSFCKGCLWPLLNSQLVTNKFDTALWDAYKQCNNHYAEEIAKIVTGSDDEVIWIHDYHVQILPESEYSPTVLSVP